MNKVLFYYYYYYYYYYPTKPGQKVIPKLRRKVNARWIQCQFGRKCRLVIQQCQSENVSDLQKECDSTIEKGKIGISEF